MILLLEYNTKCLLGWAQHLLYQTPLLWHMYFPFLSHRQMECLPEHLKHPGHLCRRIFLLYSQTLIWSVCLPGKMSGKLLPWMDLEASSMLSNAARAWAENAGERLCFWTELGRRQGEIEVLRTFYSRIPFQITWGVGEDGKGVHPFWGKYFSCQSVWQLQGEWC